jgi:hypothetical protein
MGAFSIKERPFSPRFQYNPIFRHRLMAALFLFSFQPLNFAIQFGVFFIFQFALQTL